jgi:hypothetical protein
MLYTTVVQANWLAAPATGQTSPAIPAETKPPRH